MPISGKGGRIMARFPSIEWGEALKDVINSDPEIQKAGKDFEADAVLVIEPAGAYKQRFLVYVKGRDGRVEEIKEVKDPSEVPAKFVFTSDYLTWKSIMKGETDPMKMLLTGKVKVKGDMKELLKRAKDQQLMMKALSKVKTEFADEV